MVSLVKAGYKLVYNLIPDAGTPHRTIFNSLPLLALASFLFSYKDQKRDQATLATLGLHGRLAQIKEPFIQWIKSPNKPEIITEVEANSASALVKSQLHNLISKVITAAVFYATKDIFYDSFKHLLSHSEKASKIAQPILDRVSSLPIPRLLQSARVVAFAPVIAKLIHMALIYADPKRENKVLETLKIGANRTSQGLEFLWNLRFSLLCLGISKTVYFSALSVIYSQLVNSQFVDRSISTEWIKKLLKDIPLMVGSLSYLTPTDAAPTKWGQFLSLLGSRDLWPTEGFSMGVNGILASLQESSAPCDIVALEELFNEANGLKVDIGDNEDLAVFLARIQSPIEAIKSKIALALTKEKISETYASSLCELVDLKTQKSLADLVLYPQFEGLLDDANFLALFKTIYCQKCSKDQTTNFIGFLKTLHAFRVPENLLNLTERFDPIINKKNQFLESESITPWQEKACQWILFKKIEQKFNDIIIPNLLGGKIDEIAPWLSEANTYLFFCTTTLGNCKEEVKALRSKTFKKTLDKFQSDFEAGASLDNNYMRRMSQILGKGGMIRHAFTATSEDHFLAHLMYAKFFVRQFNRKLREYLANLPADFKERERVEIDLFRLGLKTDLNYQLIAGSSGFTQWVSDQPIDSAVLKQSLAEQVQAYVNQSELFNFTRIDPIFPDDFKFATENLGSLMRRKTR